MSLWVWCKHVQIKVCSRIKLCNLLLSCKDVGKFGGLTRERQFVLEHSSSGAIFFNLAKIMVNLICWLKGSIVCSLIKLCDPLQCLQRWQQTWLVDGLFPNLMVLSSSILARDDGGLNLLTWGLDNLILNWLFSLPLIF